MILSLHPEFTYQQVKTRLTSTADDMGTAGFDYEFGYGRLNAYRALAEVSIVSPTSSTLLLQGFNHTITWTSNVNRTYTILLSTDDGGSYPYQITSAASNNSYSWNVNTPPSSNCKIKIIDNTNNQVYAISQTFIIAGVSPTIGFFSAWSDYGNPKLYWEVSNGPAWIEIWRASPETGYTWYQIATITDPSVTTYKDYSLASHKFGDQTMLYKVRARGQNYSPYSAEAGVNYYGGTWLKSKPKEDGSIDLPKDFNLNQNYPNPFNPTTSIHFDLPEDGFTTLKIYNINGQEVKSLIAQRLSPGRYDVQWNGKDNSDVGVSSGVYIYRLQSGKTTLSKKMTLAK